MSRSDRQTGAFCVGSASGVRRAVALPPPPRRGQLRLAARPQRRSTPRKLETRCALLRTTVRPKLLH